jgi:hypothetical protein
MSVLNQRFHTLGTRGQFHPDRGARNLGIILPIRWSNLDIVRDTGHTRSARNP